MSTKVVSPKKPLHGGKEGGKLQKLQKLPQLLTLGEGQGEFIHDVFI